MTSLPANPLDHNPSPPSLRRGDIVVPSAQSPEGLAAGLGAHAVLHSAGRPLVSLLAAVARNGAIGRDNALLLHLPGDLPRFKALTWGNPVVMGRRTWESIGRPLPGRRNIVLTRDPAWRAAGAEATDSLEAALRLVAGAAKVCVIGGAAVFAAALPIADALELTEIDADLDGDVFFPPWDRADYTTGEPDAHVTADGLVYRYVTHSRRALPAPPPLTRYPVPESCA